MQAVVVLNDERPSRGSQDAFSGCPTVNDSPLASLIRKGRNGRAVIICRSCSGVAMGCSCSDAAAFRFIPADLPQGRLSDVSRHRQAVHLAAL